MKLYQRRDGAWTLEVGDMSITNHNLDHLLWCANRDGYIVLEEAIIDQLPIEA